MIFTKLLWSFTTTDLGMLYLHSSNENIAVAKAVRTKSWSCLGDRRTRCPNLSGYCYIIVIRCLDREARISLSIFRRDRGIMVEVPTSPH
ncbi:hypothetical protein [Planktothricoides raciborskii]|nr:hypothetical protein [Planktothricoides raciborskii]